MHTQLISILLQSWFVLVFEVLAIEPSGTLPLRLIISLFPQGCLEFIISRVADITGVAPSLFQCFYHKNQCPP